MRIADSVDPSILELRSKVSGCAILAGLVFIASGCLTAVLVLGLFPSETFFSPELKNAGLAAGGVGIILGLILVGGRSGKIVDGRHRSLKTWSGWLVSMRQKHQQLEGYSWVVLAKETSSGKKSSTTRFPVRLEGDRGPVIQIDMCTDPLEARRIAEAVAKVLRLPLTDSSSGETVIREADHLDESLRQRFRRLGEEIEISPRPQMKHSKIQLTSSEVVAEIPGMSSKARLIMNVVVIVFVLGIGFPFFGMQFFSGVDDRWTGQLLALVFASLFVAMPLLVILTRLRGFNRTETITANRVELTVVQGRKTTKIPGGELEQLLITGKDVQQIFQTQPDGSLVIDPAHRDAPEGAEYIAKHGQPPTVPPLLAGAVRSLGRLSPDQMSIFACSDRASVRFGRGLSADEIAYLYSTILSVIVA